MKSIINEVDKKFTLFINGLFYNHLMTTWINERRDEGPKDTEVKRGPN